MEQRLVPLGLLIVGLVTLYGSLQLPYRNGPLPGSGFFPLWTSLALVLIASILTWRAWRSGRAGATTGNDVDMRRVRTMMLATVALIALTAVVGFFLPAFLYCAYCLFVLSRDLRRRTAWLSTFLIPVSIALVFRVLMGARLPGSP